MIITPPDRQRPSKTTRLIVVFLAMVTIPVGLCFITGYWLIGLAVIGFNLLLIACAVVSHARMDSRVRAVWSHLTKAERRQLQELDRAFGRLFGARVVMLALVAGISLVVMHGFQLIRAPERTLDDQILELGILLAFLIFAFLINLRNIKSHLKRRREFLSQSEYAKGQGFSD